MIARRIAKILAACVVLCSALPAAFAEDLIPFDPLRAQVLKINGRWKITVGNIWLKDFGYRCREAYQALRVIRHYGLNQQGFVGRPGPSMEYYLVSGRAPVGPMPGEDAVAFNNATIRVRRIGGRWKIVDGSHWILDFGGKQSEACKAYRIIKKYRFNRICFVGRPNASMTYFRIQPSCPQRPVNLSPSSGLQVSFPRPSAWMPLSARWIRCSAGVGAIRQTARVDPPLALLSHGVVVLPVGRQDRVGGLVSDVGVVDPDDGLAGGQVHLARALPDPPAAPAPVRHGQALAADLHLHRAPRVG